MSDNFLEIDWSDSKPDLCFVTDEGLANSVTERILCNTSISSDSDEEPPKIDRDEVFSKRNSHKNFPLYMPHMPKDIQYPKLSAITKHQHLQCLKVLCADKPHILPMENLPEPSEDDFKMFEDLKATYEKEQKEFKEWAKKRWTNTHYIRALRPKPFVEKVYEARFKMKAKEMESYPKMFNMVAQIPLKTSNNSFDMVLIRDLKTVDIEMLPEVDCESIAYKLSIMLCPVPEPCNKHPCRFILPTENKVSVLPLTEIQRELAQYAIDNNATYIASENALKTLLEMDRSWDVILSVVDVVGPDGEKTNVVVMDQEFSTNRESAVMRTYRAFKHLIQNTLVPVTQRSRLYYKDPNDYMSTFKQDPDTSSDEDDVGCCVGGFQILEQPSTSTRVVKVEVGTQKTNLYNTINDDDAGLYCYFCKGPILELPTTSKGVIKTTSCDDDAGLHSCSCEETIFERPPPRSFQKWQLRNKETKENYDIIMHCPHKVRDNSGEVILEPIPEYQLDLGASAQSRNKIRSLALSLLLRENASLVNVRIDGVTGEVATYENITSEEFEAKHGDCTGDISNVLHTAFSQLKGLSPGTYILRHEANNGNNANLYMAKPSTKPMLELKFDSTQLAEADEASYLKTPPDIIPLLLPYHKSDSKPDLCFVTDKDLANSVTERILRNDFHNPFTSSDSDEEPKIDWKKLISEVKIKYHRNPNENIQYTSIFKQDPDTSSDEDDIGLCLDGCRISEQPSTSRRIIKAEVETQKTKLYNTTSNDDDAVIYSYSYRGQTSEQKIEEAETQETELHNTTISDDDAGLYSCSCAGTIFERLPSSSFQKWQVRNEETEESYDIIIHCLHKVRNRSEEVILEPIPEYQLELGASAQSRCKIRSLALSLLLRDNATLINVRIDGATGEVATFENITSEEFEAKHGDYTGDISNTLHTALSQLKGLSPGTYILRHEANNGNNASLYMAKPSIKPMLELKFDSTQLAEADEASYLKTPPDIIPLLLPYHKFRKILPCAFTPHKDQVTRKLKRASKGKKPPPRALKKPKTTGNKKKKN